MSLVNFIWSPLSIDAGKICVNLNVLGGFHYDTFRLRQVPVIVFMVKIVVSESLEEVSERVFGISNTVMGPKFKNAESNITKVSYKKYNKQSAH